MTVYGVFQGSRLIATGFEDDFEVIRSRALALAYGCSVRALKKNEIPKCPACKGTGVIMTERPDGNHSCSACNGTGRGK
jgi:DnaJ-class molecular chaperone